MAYQNVGTPRFYIDLLSHNQSIGNIDKIFIKNDSGDITYANTNDGDDFLFDLINLNPEIINPIELLQENDLDNCRIGISFKNNIMTYYDRGFWGILNHNHGSTDTYFWARNIFTDSSTGSSSWFTEREDIINGDVVNGYGRASDGKTGTIEDGFSIMTGKMNDSGDVLGSAEFRFELNNPTNGSKTINIGSFIWGTYYDMPHSPELNLTMTIINDGYKSIKTQGGSYYANTSYESSPKWNQGDKEIEPWSVGENNIFRRRRGRRSWSLDFKYLSPKDLFSSNMSTEYYLEHTDNVSTDDWSLQGDSNKFNYNIDNDDSFESQVLNKIGNGQRFIFQPDNTNNNPDQFAICQLEQDSLLIKQESKNLYNIKLKITEVW